MEKKPQYKVLAGHVRLLAQKSPTAARKVKKDLMDAIIRSLHQMPERFPFLNAEFIFSRQKTPPLSEAKAGDEWRRTKTNFCGIIFPEHMIDRGDNHCSPSSLTGYTKAPSPRQTYSPSGRKSLHSTAPNTTWSTGLQPGNEQGQSF